MRTFQIEQRFPDGSKSWDYIETDSKDENIIKKLSIDAVIKAHKKNCEFRIMRFAPPAKPMPTIYIKEYNVKKGIKLTTKWR